MANQNIFTSVNGLQEENDAYAAAAAWGLAQNAGDAADSGTLLARPAGAVHTLPVAAPGNGAAALSLDEASAVATSAIKGGALVGFDMQLAALFYQQSGQSVQMSAFTQSVEQFEAAFSQDGQYVLIDATAADRNGANLLASLQALGLKNGSSFGAVASGWLPVQSVVQLADADNLATVRESAFTTHVGSVTTQADVAQRNDVARATYGVDGSGLRVGVLSDSFNGNGSTTDNVATNIASDDLPVNTRILFDTTGSDEGRAMGQLIHDLAPGAGVDFATAFNGQASFANNILALAAAGDRIIVDDVSYFAELSYQNGIISQAVNQVAAQGVSYFSSAGNDGTTGYQGIWNPGGTQTLNGSNYRLMQFAPGQDYLNVTYGATGQIIYSVQWDNPGASAGGVGATTDLDFFLTSSNGVTIRAGSVTSNIGGDPVELFAFTGASGVTYQLRVGLADGSPAPGEIRLLASGNGLPITLQNVASNLNASTLTGHHGAEGQMAVGAASFSQTPAFNPSVPDYVPNAEAFTSRGYNKLLFNDNGSRLAAPVITNVAFTAVDGGNTTFFSRDSGQDADTIPNFFGTSAAAPDAAATAALLLAADPTLTPQDIRALLRTSAIDLDDTYTTGFDTGDDVRTGTGLIQADRAVGFVVNRLISNPGQALLEGTHNAETINGSALDNIIIGRAGNDIIGGDAGDDQIFGGDDADTLFGNGDDDQLFGESGADVLVGGDGDDILSGAAGDDLMEGGLGDDVISGGTGSNTVSYAFTASSVSVNLGSGTATGGAGSDTLYNIQNAIGSSAADSITGSAENNVLNGGAGSDELSGSTGDDIIIGGSGAETLYLGSVEQPDVVKPQGLANTSRATAVVLTDTNFDLSFDNNIESSRTLPHATVLATAAGAGLEYYAITAAAGARAVFDIDQAAIDTVITLLDANGNQLAQNDDDFADAGSSPLNSRIDYTFSTAGTYYLRVEDFDSPTTLVAGDTYVLNVSLTSAQPTLTGTSVAGFDVIDGGDGADIASYLDAPSFVGVNLASQGTAQNTIGGGVDYLLGIEGLQGSNFNDYLAGDNGGNVLLGGAGDDLLVGGGGSDTLQGGDGADTFIYQLATDSPATTIDLILDFQTGVDKLDLTALNTSAADRFTILSANGGTLVAVDLLGDGSLDLVIQAVGNNAIAASDVLFGTGSATSTVENVAADQGAYSAADVHVAFQALAAGASDGSLHLV